MTVEFVTPPKVAGMPKTKVAQPCADGRRTHEYGEDGLCRHCGYKRPYPQAKSRTTARGTRERQPARPSAATMSQAKARAIIFGAGGLAQRLAIELVEKEKREEFANGPWPLKAEELLLLSDVVADEAIRSKTIMAWLAKMEVAGPHAKLAMVSAVIIFPRAAAAGWIPQELADEFGRAAAMALASGTPRDSDRGDVRWEVDPGGGGPVTTPPIPPGESYEDGPSTTSSAVPGERSDQDAQDLVGSEMEPDRAPDGGQANGRASEGELPSPFNSVASRRMDRIRR